MLALSRITWLKIPQTRQEIISYINLVGIILNGALIMIWSRVKLYFLVSVEVKETLHF